MNKKNLAIKISKHPLLKKLTEDKTIPNSVVARLIVEEMTKEQSTAIDNRMDSLTKTQNAKEAKQLQSQINKLISTNLPNDQENRLMAYMTQLNGIIQQNSNVEKEPESGSNIDKYEEAIAEANTREEIMNIQNQIKADKTLINGELLALNDMIRAALQDIDTPVDKEKTETSENPYKDIEGYADLKLDKEQETIFISFLNKLKEQKIIKEGNLRGLNKILGTESQKLADIIQSYKKPEMDILIGLLKDDEIQAFIQKNLSNITEPETGGETSGETKDPPPSEIPEAEKKQYVDASTKLQNEFYNQKYRIEQAKLIGAVIDAIEKIYDNPNKVAAFSRPPQEPKPVSEQQETVEASKDELRNLRVDFRSFLSRVNKTSKALEKFEEMKDSGSMITDTYKKQFIDLLKEVQMSIKRIHRDLQVIIGKRQINEIDENSDVMKKWKEVEGKYNKAVASASALRELIDGTSTSEEPEQIIQDTYASLSDLSTHFPSINPFASSGAKTREDMNKYKNSFENAVKQVKSDLQNVLALINQGQSGEDTLQLAMEGLKTFSGAIQNTFGIQSQFKDIKVEKDTPAAQGDPEAKPEEPDNAKVQIEAQEAIEEFLQILLKEKIVVQRKSEEELTEALGTIALAAIGGASLAGIFKEMSTRYSSSDDRVLGIFQKLLYKFLEKNKFLNSETNKGEERFTEAWENFPEQQKEVIAKAYRKKFKQKPELTGKKVQEIVADYLTDDFKLKDIEEPSGESSELSQPEADTSDEKEAAMELVQKYRLAELQQEAKMTSGEMQLYIKLLIALQEEGIVKLNEVVVTDDIQKVIRTFDQEEQKTLMGILKKQGVYKHLLSLRTDEFGEEGYETIDGEEEDPGEEPSELSQPEADTGEEKDGTDSGDKEELIKKIKDFDDETSSADKEQGFANLSSADLSNAKLSEVSFVSAELSGANLSSADLSDADLFNAYLIGADLIGADLRDADLRGADLRDADLRGADLSGADLSDADLGGAKYNKQTKFPEGFEIDGQNMTLVDEEDNVEDLVSEKVEFLNKKREEIVLRPEAGGKNYKIIGFEADQFMEGPISIDIKYKDGNKEEKMLTTSKGSIEDLYNVMKDKNDPSRFESLTNIYDAEGEKLPFSFKLIKPLGSLTERIEKLIKPLIKEMLTKGK